MTDDEYRAYLSALARRHLRRVSNADARVLEAAALRLSDTARLNREARERAMFGDFHQDGTVADRPSRPLNDLLHELGHELDLRSEDVAKVFAVMERCGVLGALDEVPSVTFGEVRPAAVPREDLDMLRRCGVDEPEAEVEIVSQYCRSEASQFYYRRSESSSPSGHIEKAPEELRKTAKMFRANAPLSEPGVQGATPLKKRKIFNGIGKILAGAVGAAGNTLLIGGTIVAPNPATGHLAIASSAIAVGSIFQGIGDLRGE